MNWLKILKKRIRLTFYKLMDMGHYHQWNTPALSLAWRLYLSLLAQSPGTVSQDFGVKSQDMSAVSGKVRIILFPAKGLGDEYMKFDKQMQQIQKW